MEWSVMSASARHWSVLTGPTVAVAAGTVAVLAFAAAAVAAGSRCTRST